MELRPALVLRQAQDEGLFLIAAQTAVPHPELVEGCKASTHASRAHNQRNEFTALPQERAGAFAAGTKRSRIDTVLQTIAVAGLCAAFASGQTCCSAQKCAARDR